MNATALIARLEPLPATLITLLANLPDPDWRWRPEGGAWSILEVVNHLVDTEVEDFRARLRSTLEDPSRPWAPMDPEGAVTSRGRCNGATGESLRRFHEERETSLKWLRGLANAKWDNTYAHPRGPITAGDLMASWTAHDARHLQQIGKRLHGLAFRDGAPYSVAYAG